MFFSTPGQIPILGGDLAVQIKSNIFAHAGKS